MQNSKIKGVQNLKAEECLKQEYIDKSGVKLEADTGLTYSQSFDRDTASADGSNFFSETPKTKVKNAPNSKHIIKNYGKAMCAFASSEMAKPYLEKIVLKKAAKMQEFQTYIKKQRKTIDSMKSIRNLLLIARADNEKVREYKEIFKEISVVFIKFFSVNWVFQGKMTFKKEHVNARFKMLRRIRNPEHFTYFKDFTKYI